jgi:hypothetical protein
MRTVPIRSVLAEIGHSRWGIRTLTRGVIGNGPSSPNALACRRRRYPQSSAPSFLRVTQTQRKTPSGVGSDGVLFRQKGRRGLGGAMRGWGNGVNER